MQHQTDQSFKLNSKDIKDGLPLPAAQVYDRFGCSGGNQSPHLEWSEAPAGTESFAVTVYDPDAPSGSGWWHWVVFDIPASVSELRSGAGQAGRLPDCAKHGRNDYGSSDFGGACPPPGDKPHRYVFTVHALKTAKLDVPVDATSAMIGFMLKANTLATATLTAIYGR